MYKPVSLIEVWIWGERVGALAEDPKLGFYAFEYDPAWVKLGIELAPLSMPLSKAEEPFVFTSLPEATFKRLPALISDSLPDDFGNALIDAWMTERGIHYNQITPLDRLAYMGKRAMGALEFRPARSPEARSATAIEIGKLVESARLAVHGDLTSERQSTDLLHEIIRVGTSAGGARAKAVVAWNRSTNEVRAGQFSVPEGFEHWLLKFDGLGKDGELGSSGSYGRIEFAYSLMAKAAGIDVSESRLLEENGRAHFMTRRFDREYGGIKHHLLTLCAMSHLDYKQRATHSYHQLFATMARLQLSDSQMQEAFRRMVFNIYSFNHDDHTKNISFILRKGSGWSLAPAYDVTYAYNPQGVWNYQHLMSVMGKYADISDDDLMECAEDFNIKRTRLILQEVRDAINLWPTFASRAGVPSETANLIGENLQRMKMLQ